MRTLVIWLALLLAMAATALALRVQPSPAAVSENEEHGWKLYTDARFGFSLRYPNEWHLGTPLPDGAGVTLHPSIQQSLVTVSGHMNVVSGSNQDGRQTLNEFASAHRRIMTELYGKRAISINWRQDEERSLGGFPGRHLAFTYKNDKQGEIIEHHLFSLGRNEGRGIRIKVPLVSEHQLMPIIERMLTTYQAGRDQNAVGPLKPQSEQPTVAPR